MLRRGAETADHERRHQPGKAAQSRQTIAKAGQGGAAREHGGCAPALGQKAGGNLQSRHGAGEHAAQQADRGIAEAELGLPDRQHDVDQIGIAVVQRVRAGGDRQSAAFVALGVGRLRCDGGHSLARGRRPTKAVLRKDTTVSPCWFVPVLRNPTSPHSGRLSEARFSATSVA